MTAVATDIQCHEVHRMTQEAKQGVRLLRKAVRVTIAAVGAGHNIEVATESSNNG